MSRWSSFYQGRVGDSYADYAAVRYKPMIDALLTLGGNYREEGCGIGTISKVLARNAVKNISISDNDNDIMELAKINTKLTNCNLFDIRVGCNDKVDVIFTHGVLEHFCDYDIDLILKQQRKVSGRSIHYVPTDGYSNPSFGDERLMPYWYWIERFNPKEHILFNDNKDLLIVF